ncbi:hypothetical protein GCM10027049_05400 [Mucilaginibacter puniceus]
MNNYFLLRISVLMLILSVCTLHGHAQDTVKKATTVKKTAATTKAVDSKTGIPINPKTGRPYTKYGYGAYATQKYDATKTARAADSLKKAAAITQQPVTVDKSLNAQYQDLLTKVYNYQKPFVSALWKNVTDTINSNRRKLKEAQATIATQTQTIKGLEGDVTEKEESLAVADSINLFGASLSKSAYNLIMWGLVIVAGSIAAIVIARSGSNKREAAYRIQLYNELEEEFKAHKTKANEKEKKLARELQTERNKVDELMGRG